MKKFRVLQAILVLFSALAVTSCGDEPALEPSNNGFSDADMRVAVGNEMFVADAVTGNVAGGAITLTGIGEEENTGKVMTVTLQQTQLTLSVTGNETVYNNVSMTYVDGAGGDQYVNQYENAEGEIVTTGSVIITALDIENHTISGHFAFTGYNDEGDAMPFYSGSFTNVAYTGNLPAALPPPTVAPTYYLRAKINDGDLINYGTPTAEPASGSLILSGGTVNPLTSLSITVDEDILPGTYPFATSPVDGPYGVYNDVGVQHISEEGGTLTIISNAEGVIKGTFSFTAVHEDATVEVTAGEFNLQIEED